MIHEENSISQVELKFDKIKKINCSKLKYNYYDRRREKRV